MIASIAWNAFKKVASDRRASPGMSTMAQNNIIAKTVVHENTARGVDVFNRVGRVAPPPPRRASSVDAIVGNDDGAKKAP